MAVISVVIPNGGTKNWTDYTITSGDTIDITQSGGDDNGTFIFNTAAVSCAGVSIQTGKSVTLRFNSNGVVTINGSVTNMWSVDVQGTSIFKISAVGAAANVAATFQSRTGVVGYAIAAGAKVQFIGDATYRVNHYEAGMLGGTAHFPTLTGMSYPIPTAGGTIEVIYSYMWSMSRLHGKTSGETLTLLDALYMFKVTTEPEEQIVAGTLTLTRSVIKTYENRTWYIKPTGTITLLQSFFDDLLPSIYSTNYYIVLLSRTTKVTVKYRAVESVEDTFLGSDGSYIEITSRKSSVVTVVAYLRYGTVWDHPLAQRKFLAQIMELKSAQGEKVKFTWQDGHFGKAYLRDHDDLIPPGRAFYEGRYEVKFEVIEAPYN
jgi:hypothetical protein